MKEYAAKLLELDQQARAILEEAGAYRDQVDSDIQARKDALRQEYEEKANKHIHQVRDAEAQTVAEESSALRERHSRLSAQMEELYLQQHTDWEEALYRLCLEEW